MSQVVLKVPIEISHKVTNKTKSRTVPEKLATRKDTQTSYNQGSQTGW